MFRKPSVSLAGFLLLTLVLLAGVPHTSAQVSPLTVNEILPGNASTYLDPDTFNYSPWIEIYNGSQTAVDLKNYSLSYLEDGEDAPVIWKIPVSTIVPAKGWALLWADGEGRKTHASFELDMRGSEIKLLDPSNNVLDTVTYDMRDGKTLLPDVSYGREVDGGGGWVYFDVPTPAAANLSIRHAAPTLAEAPAFSPPGGFYPGSQSVSLSTTETGGSIRYTLDGSVPTTSSALYLGPLNISTSTVVRARVFTSGKLASQTASDTYLIDVARNLPVISLATLPAHLFDDTMGIYVAGTNGVAGNCSTEPVNWNQSWERPFSMEMFETDGSRVVAQDVGIEIFGGCSRVFTQKSFEIKARRTYGDNDIDYQVLPDKPIDSYKRLILRNSGNDAHGTLFRDALQQYLVKDTMDIDYQAYRPVVVFLNGAYWGIYNVRDKADEAFVEQNYDLDADTDFDMLENRGKIDAGNSMAWDALHDFISTHDLRVQANYDYVKSQIDLDEYMNYFITEIYINNVDWPMTNIRYWRAYDNGRWRWVLNDLDKGFELNEVHTNLLGYLLTCDDCPEAVIYQATVFRKLMENPEFRADFAQRFATHMATSFAPARVNAMIDGFKTGIESEMPAHIARWEKPSSIAEWNMWIDRLRQFGNLRSTAVTAYLNAYLGWPGTANLTVKVIGSGDVTVAGVEVPAGGYQGINFMNVPLKLTAASRPGWLFSGWHETGSPDARISITLSGDRTQTAVFKRATQAAYLPLSVAP